MPTRKDVLTGAAALALSSSAALGQAARAAEARGFSDAIARGLPSADQVWGWEKKLAAWAPCFTGSPSHNAWVDWLGAQLKAAGIAPRRQAFRFPYWQPHSYGLWLDGKPVHATGYRPHSGSTGPAGVTAPMVYAGVTPNLDVSGAAGKIVLIDVAALARPNLAGTTPVQTGMGAPNLDPAIKAGARAVVYIWNGFSDANAQWQMQPFFGPPTTVPTLWVGQAAGARLKAAAAKGANLKFVLDATEHPDTASDTVWGLLPGATDEVVVVNTHTDGCNATEENGGLAIVALAHALAKLPRAKRRRTYVFLMTTGHFSHGFIRGAESWQKENPELMAKAVACMTCEHLGAREWRDVAGVYKDTGTFTPATAYTPTQPMARLFTEVAAASGAPAMTAIDPTAPGQRFYGEGSSFWRAGVPTVAYITGPDYLMAAPPHGGEIEKLDKARLHQELVVFARTLERIEGLSREQIKG
ncbi:hypothetical protein [Phenylobacterium sp.]|uniref:hypothetical protein n=1 Tax=Phenylobacterium sp. TaxID=1871053 RepID=UPI002DEBDDA0|nr:hypothetical protein [Phenylobacterium sp.]